jgi:ABC-type antimicrobial peptide transport system permease subunit
MAMTIGGLVVGLVGAFFLTQTLSRLLYGVSTRDPMSFLVVPLILLVVALIASAAPAWRATRIDPLVALRYE